VAEPGWTPSVPTPNHPEYPAALSSFFHFPEFTLNHRVVVAFRRVSASEFEDRR
jgi:hypothetical protein